YVSPKSGRAIQLIARDGQQIASIDGFEFPFVRCEDGVLRPSVTFGGFRVEIEVRGPSDRPKSIRLSDFGNEDDLLKVEPATNPNTDEILGRYVYETTGTTAIISKIDDTVKLNTLGRFGSLEYELEYLADALWRATSKQITFVHAVLLFAK